MPPATPAHVHGICLAGVVFLQLLAVPRALAQDLNAQRFRPAVATDAFLLLEDARRTPLGLGGNLTFNYAQNPFVYRYDDPILESTAILGNVSSANLQAFAGLGPTRLGVDLPLHLYASGDARLAAPYILGDLALDAKLHVLDRERRPLGLAVHLQGTLPTGNEEAWLGDGRPTVAADLDAAMGQVLIGALNLGFATGNGSQVGDLTWGGRLRWGAGVRAPVTDPIFVCIEIGGEVLLASAGSPRGAPPQARLGLRTRPMGHLVSGFAMGTGLGHGVGAPSLRLAANLGWTPLPPDAPPGRRMDHDRDGLVDARDLCPEQAEDYNGRKDRDGCPDQDMALLQLRTQTYDQLPLTTDVSVIDAHGRKHTWRASGGTWMRALPAGPIGLRVSAPHHESLSTDLTLPEAGSAVLSFKLNPLHSDDQLGADPRRADRRKDVDTDGDGIVDQRDVCPEQPEEANDLYDDDGCPDDYLTTTRFAIQDQAGNAISDASVMLPTGPMVGGWQRLEEQLVLALVPGRYQLHASAAGYQSSELELDIPQAAQHEVVVPLRPGLALSPLALTVLDEQGEPLDARIRLSGVETKTIATGPDGQADLHLQPGDYQLRVSSVGYASHRRLLRFEPEQTSQLQVSLLPMSGDAQPMPGEDVFLFETDSDQLQAETLPALSRLADRLRAEPDILLLSLQGYTAPRGERGNDERYSFQLAQRILRWLVEEESISPQRLVAIGMGSGVQDASPAMPAQRVEARVAVRRETSSPSLSE